VGDFSGDEREAWTHRLGNLMLLSQRKNASLGNLDFADKRKRYLETRVESLPNSQRCLGLARLKHRTSGRDMTICSGRWSRLTRRLQ
jgi:hypothetical protein